MKRKLQAFEKGDGSKKAPSKPSTVAPGPNRKQI